MLSKQEIEKKLLESIGENDPQKDAKTLEIKSWYLSYRFILETYATKGKNIDLFSTVLKECWNGNKIDRIKVGRKLLKLELKGTGDAEDKFYIINDFDRYRIACWCCLEEEAKALFEKFKNASLPKEASEIDIECFSKNLRGGPLMIFWSYSFGGVEFKTKPKDKSIYEYGFECAMAEKRVEALSFFWDNLPEDKKNPETLMEIALYDSIKGRATTDMIIFCLKTLQENKDKDIFKRDDPSVLYKELLKKDYEKNGYYSTLSKLIHDQNFKNAKRLFRYIEKKDISPKNYNTLISIILDEISKLPNDSSLFKSARDMFDAIYNGMEENHKDFFLNELRAQFSPVRSEIVSLLESGKVVDLLNKIISSLDQKQIKSVIDFDKPAYNIFLKKESFKLESLKNLMASINGEISSMSGAMENLKDLKNQLNDVITKMEK